MMHDVHVHDGYESMKHCYFPIVFISQAGPNSNGYGIVVIVASQM